MKISELWLREWVDVPASAKDIADKLLMAGLELEIEPVLAEPLPDIVVGHIERLAPHPQADKLRIAEVNAGARHFQVVCGAPNAREGLKAPLALPGARLPGGVEIRPAKLRGVESAGMLCSAKELGLADKSEGLLELDADAPAGLALVDYLKLDDRVLALEITPNRGDCLSVQGLAREVAALFDRPLRKHVIAAAAVASQQQLRVEIENLDDCPNYAGRVVAGLDPRARTPDWLREKLRRCGVRSIQPVVDITNYVMLELGQPMHAFDLARLTGVVRVRRARAGEKLTLLNQQAVELSDADLLIADDRGPLALAGVMGGAESEVAAETTSVFLESACFAPAAVAGTGRRHKLSSDAVYRFERGVDPTIQREALERATQLILQICGGAAGPVTHRGKIEPEPVLVSLRHERLRALLGYEIAAEEVERLLSRLGVAVSRAAPGVWNCAVPSHRYDLRIEEDLIEEAARMYGYERIPTRPYAAVLVPSRPSEMLRSAAQARERLIARGWQDVVTYSFVEPKVQEALAPGEPTIGVDNPIADTLSVMRTSLWAGLIPAWRYNAQRQRSRVRLFELGVCFSERQGRVIETQRLGGLASGSALPEQWGVKGRKVDFYDVKGDLVALLGADCRYQKAEHPALHPGQCARILRDGAPIGWLGLLHPAVARRLDLAEQPLLFELDWEALAQIGLPQVEPLSEFPSSRRDIAVVLREEIPAETLLACVRAAAGPRLRELRAFDLYRGQPLGDGFKSIALGLIFQDYSRTLTDTDVDTATQAVVERLEKELSATIRS